MLICDKCGAQIPQGAKFCPQCADPVTEADIVTQPQDVSTEIGEQEVIVCPKCQFQFHYGISVGGPRCSLCCPKCSMSFESLVTKVRAKRARGYRRENRRHFSIRVVDASGSEELIEFMNTGYEDFELRAKDVAVFSYIGDQLKLVQNLTIGHYMKVSKPACYLATYLYGETSEIVAVLRLFRDEVFLGSPIVAPLVSVYYRTSPIMIRWLGNSNLFRGVCLALMAPISNSVMSWHRDRMEKSQATE